MSLSSSCRAVLVLGLSALHVATFSADREVTTNLDNIAGSLRTVIAAADPGDRIIFGPDATGPILYSLDADIVIDKDLTIDASDVPGGVTISAENRDRVFSIQSATTVEMVNLTITNGKAADGSSGTATANPGEAGGGIHNGGDLTLRNCVVTGNRAGDGGSASENIGRPGGSGGGIYSTGSLTLVDCVVSENSTGSGGTGGVGTDMSLKNGGQAGNGGGICQLSSDALTITRGTISDNSTGDGGTGSFNGRAGGSGGGVYTTGPLLMNASTISGNTTGNGGVSGMSSGQAGGDGGKGGGLHLNSADPAILVNTTISGNRTGFGGIGAPFEPGNGGSGGGVYAEGPVTFEHVTVFGNETRSVPDGVVGNPGHGIGGSGGGIHVTDEGNASLKNSVIAMNIVADEGEGADFFLDGTVDAQSVNCIGDNSTVEVTFPEGVLAGTEAAPVDPLLGPLAANGGGTLTHLPAASSPLVDPPGGDAAPSSTTDQRGSTRRSGFAVDIGAVEYLYPSILLSAPAQVKTKKSKANIRVSVSSPVTSSLSARATSKAKVTVVGSGGTYLVKAKRLAKKKTKVFLTATDALGRTASALVQIKLKKKRR